MSSESNLEDPDPAPPTDSLIEKLRPKLRELESQRRAAQRSAALWIALGWISGLGVLSLSIFARNHIELSIFVAVAFALCALPIWHAREVRSGIRNDVRSAIMPPVCEHLGLSYERFPRDFSVAPYRHNDIVPGYDAATLRDRIHGRYQGVELDFCQAYLERVISVSNPKGGANTDSRGVFSGMLMSFSFPERFRGCTVVSRNAGALSNILTRTRGWRGERVAFESREFERIYEVYSDDPGQARTLLTPALRERLVELRERLDSVPQLLFESDRLKLAVESTYPRFRGPALPSPLDDGKHALEMLRDVQIIFDVIHTLRLQPRTWT